MLERGVAARAPPATRRSKISHCRVTEHAAAAIHARQRRLLLHRLQEITKRMLRRRNARLDPVLCRTALAQMQQLHFAALDLRELHDRVALSTAVAQHQASTSRTPVFVSRPSSSRSARSARSANDRLCVTT